MKPRICDVTSCPFHGGKPVWGTGPSSPICMLIGEAPGKEEEAYGIPFCGKSGQELTMYLKQFTKVSRDRCWVDNIIKCRPPKNRNPHVDEIESCNNYLATELIRLQPSTIGAVGRVSTQVFLQRKVPMDKVHGIPEYWNSSFGNKKVIIVPLYHPAFGLHSPHQMKDVIEDFTALGRVIRGQLEPRQKRETELDYRLEEENDG